MRVMHNANFGHDNQWPSLKDIPSPSIDAETAMKRIRSWPFFAMTPLSESPEMAARIGVDRVYIKDESQRFDLGNFKALGAYYYVAGEAEAGRAKGTTYVCASAGNHGLSLAKGAKDFGANAVIYLDENVAESFVTRLVQLGAHVIRQGANYESAQRAAHEAARDQGWILVSDIATAHDYDIPRQVIEGYLAILVETMAQMDGVPTHIFLQAGVGGMAASLSALARNIWGGGPIITIVEPTRAPSIYTSIADGAPTRFGEGVSIMGRLDCKEASLTALKGLSRDANAFALIDEDEARNGVREAAQYGFHSSPSGAAGIAALFASDRWRSELGIFEDSRILVILTEGKVDE